MFELYTKQWVIFIFDTVAVTGSHTRRIGLFCVFYPLLRTCIDIWLNVSLEGLALSRQSRYPSTSFSWAWRSWFWSRTLFFFFFFLLTGILSLSWRNTLKLTSLWTVTLPVPAVSSLMACFIVTIFLLSDSDSSGLPPDIHATPPSPPTK